MQFTFDSYIGEKFNRCYFNSDNFKFLVIESFETSFQRIGGEFQPEMGCWTFPKNVHSHIIELIIHNTCFVCGGLMKDGVALQQGKVIAESYDSAMDTYLGEIEYPYNKDTKLIKVRKCQACGHSHT
ncbi:MAG: hypothetical protein RLY43_2496 [Bacteroidota bacterium]|jgi:hypothetical protein